MLSRIFGNVVLVVFLLIVAALTAASAVRFFEGEILFVLPTLFGVVVSIFLGWGLIAPIARHRL